MKYIACAQFECDGWMKPIENSGFRRIIIFKCEKCGHERSMPRKGVEAWRLGRFVSIFR